jgi:8-oxo-dGTP pyrophosphatase MutT (NUDIX family)/sugar/nucleoside kinase (ribokinase family)
MIGTLGRQLVFVGHIGCDVYAVADDSIYVRPAGSAYNAACGLLAIGGKGTFIATISQCFNRSWLAKFAKSEVHVEEQCADPGPENVFLFDMRGPGSPAGVFSLGQPETPSVASLQHDPFRNPHVHLGTMRPEGVSLIWHSVREAKPAASFSCNLYGPYLERGWDTIAPVVESCSIVFLNDAELAQLKVLGAVDQVFRKKLVLVTCGELGAMCFVDGVPYFAYSPEARQAACPIGAGDVFVGAFLGPFLAGTPLSSAVAVAVEAAAASVADFGVDSVLRAGDQLRTLGAQDTLRTPRLDLVPPSRFNVEPAAYDRVVEATGLFVVRDHQLLLVRKRDDKAFRPGVLYVPGGKFEPGETSEQCGTRELKEETGLDGGRFRFLGISYFPDPANHRKLYRFTQFLVTDSVGDVVANDDVIEAVWQPFETLDRLQLFEMTWAQLLLLNLVPGSELA